MKKWRAFALAILLFLSVPVMAGTYRPKDGILSFFILLAFLLALWGIFHLVDLIRTTLRNIRKELDFEDLF